MANPNLIDTTRIQDIQLSKEDYRSQFEAYWASGDYASAFGILTTYQTELKTCVADQTSFNKIIYGIVANEFNYSSNTTTVFTTLEQEQQNNIDAILDRLAYVATTQYEVGNFCSYDGEMYFCTVRPDIGTLPTDTDYWLYVGIRGDTGAKGLGVDLRGKWHNDITYYAEDVVFYDDKIYVAKITNEGVLPTTTSTWLMSFYVERETIQVSSTTPDVETGTIWIKELASDVCVWKVRGSSADDDILLVTDNGTLPTTYGYASNNHTFTTDIPLCDTSKYIIVDSANNILKSIQGEEWVLEQSCDFQVNSGICCSRNTIILCGNGGNMLVNHNFGSSISVNPQFGTSDIYKVGQVGQNYFAVGLLGKISKSSNAISWTALTSGISTTLRGIAGNASLILAVGDGGVVIKSEDDGANWSSATSLSSDVLDIGIYDSTFYLLTAHNIYSTTDGATYTELFDDSTITLVKLSVCNGNVVAIGNNASGGVVLTRYISDSSWSQSIISGATLYSVAMGYCGTIVGSQDGLVYISADSKTNWSAYSTYLGYNVICAVSILDNAYNIFTVTAMPTSAFTADDTIELIADGQSTDNIILYSLGNELAGDNAFVANIPISLTMDINNPLDRRAFIDTDSTVFPRLATSTISVDETTLSWDSVSGASSYSIYSGETEIATTSSTSIDLSDYITAVGTYYIHIVSSGTGYRESRNSNILEYVIESLPILDTPSISLDGDILSWSAVTNATSYSIRSSGSQVTTTTSTSIDLSGVFTIDGTYYVTVVAKANGYDDSAASNSVTYVVSTSLPTLSSPTIQLSGDTLSWNSVSNATYYSIRSSGSQFTTTSSTSINLADYLTTEGTYYITVVAKASGYNSSSPSNQVTYTVVTSLPTLNAPTISLNGDTLSWNSVSAATSYSVRSSGSEIVSTSSTSANLSNYLTTSGTYYITVVAQASGYNDSSPSNQVTYVVSIPITYYTISYNANGGTGTTASQTVESGGSVLLRSSGYTRTGYTFAGWSEYSTGNAQYPAGEAITLYNVTRNYLLYAIWTLDKIDNLVSVTWYGEANRALKASTPYAVTSTLNISVRVVDELYGTHTITITINNGYKYGYYMSPDNDISSFTITGVSPTSDATYRYTYSSGTVVYI